ncbi:MAG: N-acyl homoserine lactonase family protein [Candidatus Bathyarchaeota archaeon]|nr:MAG: N-acyl homoserine lactonase family protein [Candidatus Bathyarchaeota archaeon]
MAEIEVLVHCFYIQVGLKNGHPILSVRWPLTPMPEPEIGNVYGKFVFNLGSTNTVLIKDHGKNIIVDPGIIQLGRYGALIARLNEVGLSPKDIDVIINTHCHYDHIESNYLFKGKELLIHEKELDFCRTRYWPEYVDAFMNILNVKPVANDFALTDNIRIIETPGHTPGSLSIIVDTPKEVVAIVGDAVIVKDDLLELKPPSVVTSNANPEEALKSLKKIAQYQPRLVIPGHDAPFSFIPTNPARAR